MRLLLILFVMVGLTACSSVPTRDGAQSNLNLVIIGEDADLGSVSRDSRVFRRVLRGVADQLDSDGFAVYDLAARADGLTRRKGRKDDDTQVLAVARSFRHPPIDVAVIFSIYAVIQDKGYTQQLRTRIDGRLLDVNSGQGLGHFEVVSPGNWTVHPQCQADCIEEKLGDHARVLASDLGAVLSERLRGLRGHKQGHSNDNIGIGSGYTLIFEGFKPDEVLEIEEYLEIFSGYHSHRPVYSAQRRVEFWYQSSISTAKLNRNLHRVLDRLVLKGRVVFSGNTYTVTKITLRENTRPVNKDQW